MSSLFRFKFFKEVLTCFAIFRKHLGNRLWIVFFFTILAVFTEAFGIVLLLPLLEGVEGGPSDPSVITRMLSPLLEFLGIAESITGILFFIAIIILVKGGIRFLEGSYKASLTSSLLQEIKGKLITGYEGMDYTHYLEHNTGHFINILTEQVNRLLHAFEAYKRFVSQVIIAVFYLLFAFLLSWKFALMAAVAGGTILFFFRSVNRYVKKISRRTSREYGFFHALLVQALQGFPYLKATGQFEFIKKRVEHSIGRLARYYRNQQMAYAVTHALREPVSIVLILLIIIVHLIFFETRISAIIVSLLMIYRALGHTFSVQSSWQQTMNMIGGLEMVEKELHHIARRQEPDNGSDKSETIINTEITKATDSKPPTKRFSNHLFFDKVSYRYPGRKDPALRQITLGFDAHQAVAFFGASGSGKTTLLKVLTLLLTPQQGEFRIDGVSHKKLCRDHWRRQIGYVPQEPVLFDDTIAKNISMTDEDHKTSEELNHKILKAARQAHALDFIEKFPNGLSTQTGDRGVRLSGGQKQRICIARELFRNPEILVLDEATSALDLESERLIHQSIEQLKGKMTIILVAHRLSTIRYADKIFVLDQGRLIANGTYQELTGIPLFQRMIDERPL